MSAANDLYAPLSARSEGRFKGFRLRLGPALAVPGALAAALAGWVALVDDPLGGEPRARVPMPALAAADQPRGPAVAPARAPAPEAAAAERPPEPPPGRTNVTIITPGPPGQGMQSRVVEVPDGRPPPETRPQTAAPRVVPDPRLADKHRHGIIPRIGDDGTRPWRFYARQTPPPRPGARRVAILVTGLGLATAATNDAITRLPAEITFAFSPYAGNLQAQINRARNDGHEVMLQVPMEPFDYPANDPGPQALLSGLPAEQNLDRLHWALARAAGYTGVVNMMGGKFSVNGQALTPVLQDLRARGLLFVDDGASARSLAPQIARDVGLAHQRASIAIDASPSGDRIDEALVALEDEAQRSGVALGVTSLLPVSIERIARWARDLDRRGITLVPVSAIAVGDTGN